MAKISRQIESEAAELANMYSTSRRPMVDVYEVAEKLGLTTAAHDLGDNVSGVLYIDKGQGVIGYNENESPVRRRFTVAHEIGHYILHRLDKEIFVDKQAFKGAYRDDKSTTGENQQEREANAFAAALLMPKDRLIVELNKMPFDLSDEKEDVIGELARKFKVSTTAMMYRISNLGLF